MSTVDTSTLTQDLQQLAAQDVADSDRRYVQLVLDVAHNRVTDPQQIHEALCYLGRTADQLNKDLHQYERVRADFDLWAEVPPRELAHENAQRASGEARDAVREVRSQIDTLRLRLSNAERTVMSCEAEERNARHALMAAEEAGQRLMDRPESLRFLPPMWQTKMQHIRALRSEAAHLERECDVLRAGATAHSKQNMELVVEREKRQKNNWRNQYNMPEVAARKEAEDEAFIRQANVQIDNNTRAADTAAAEHNRLAAELLQVRQQLVQARAEVSQLLSRKE